MVDVAAVAVVPGRVPRPLPAQCALLPVAVVVPALCELVVIVGAGNGWFQTLVQAGVLLLIGLLLWLMMGDDE